MAQSRLPNDRPYEATVSVGDSLSLIVRVPPRVDLGSEVRIRLGVANRLPRAVAISYRGYHPGIPRVSRRGRLWWTNTTAIIETVRRSTIQRGDTLWTTHLWDGHPNSLEMGLTAETGTYLVEGWFFLADKILPIKTPPSHLILVRSKPRWAAVADTSHSEQDR